MSSELPSATFARRLRQKRTEAGISQTELAHRVSELLGTTVDGSAVTRIENGTRAVRLDEAVCAAEVLDVPLGILLGDDEARRAELRQALTHEHGRAEAASKEYQQAQDAIRSIEQALEKLSA